MFRRGKTAQRRQTIPLSEVHCAKSSAQHLSSLLLSLRTPLGTPLATSPLFYSSRLQDRRSLSFSALRRKCRKCRKSGSAESVENPNGNVRLQRRALARYTLGRRVPCSMPAPGWVYIRGLYLGGGGIPGCTWERSIPWCTWEAYVPPPPKAVLGSVCPS